MGVTHNSVDGTTADFPHPDLPKIHGEPNRDSLIEIHGLLCENASSVTTNQGGGNHGHLALMLSAKAYNEQTKHDFIPPPNPGDAPAIATAGENRAQEQAGLDEIFKRATRLYDRYNTTDKALKKQIESAVERPYLAELRDQLTGFSQVTALALMSHLYDNYGLIDDVDLETNQVTMMKPYDPETPLANLVDQLQRGRNFANIGDQGLTDGMLISKGITLLSNTAVFNDDIKDWNRQDSKDKTWANFKTHFQRAHRERRKAVTTAGQGGYNASVHNVYGYNATVNNVYGNADDEAHRALQQAAADSLSTIAGGMADNQTNLTELSQANAVLTASNTTMAAQMAQLMSGMQLLQTQMAQNTAGNGGKGSTGNGRRNNPNPLPWAYCWSHGKCKHTGAVCQKKKEGHKDAATMENKMGGSTYNM
jgi:hypothetical protein